MHPLQRSLVSAKIRGIESIVHQPSAPPIVDPTGQIWWNHMLAGDFEAAWRISDAHRRACIPDPHRMWDGSPIAGRRVMLRCLHGFGDSVQLLRYAPLLRAQATALTVEVAPRMVDLAQCFAGPDQVVTWGDAAPPLPPPWDLQIEINELPYLFRTTLATIPQPPLPYLHLPEPALAAARVALARHAVGPRIGLAWQSSGWDPARSLPMALLLEAVRPCGAHLVSLQAPADEIDWQDLMRTDQRLHTANSCGEGLLPLACAIATLDLIITVDTVTAHLAGALGRPTWLLLQHEADWRWMQGRSDSPWYPTLRLFRQPQPAQPGDPAAWTPVLDQVRTKLHQMHLESIQNASNATLKECP